MHFLVTLFWLFIFVPYAQSIECKNNSDQCVVQHANAYNGLKSQLDGPNCWNTALMASGILSHRRYVNDKEFIFYMNSPLCSKLDRSDLKIAGDIGSIGLKSRLIRGAEGIDHAFVHLNEDLIFSKRNPLKHHALAISQFEELLKDYEINKHDKCFLDDSSAECNVTLTYYRCQSLKESLDQEKSIHPEVLKIFNSLKPLEIELENIVMKTIFNTEKLHNYSRKLRLGIKRIPKDALIEGDDNLKYNRFLVEILNVRLTSIIQQIRIVSEDFQTKHQVIKKGKIENELLKARTEIEKLLEIQPNMSIF